MEPLTPKNSNTEAQRSKAALREQVRAALRGMTAEDRASASRQACALLEQQLLWQKATSVLFYAPLPAEIDVWPLLEAALAGGKMVCLPRFDTEPQRFVACRIENLERDVKAGAFGVREPGEASARIGLNRLDLLLVPGIAFDLDGRRLGRGKGHYDQLLELPHGTTCGVAFDQQIAARIPVEPHDVPLNCILTPTRWRFIAGPREVLK